MGWIKFYLKVTKNASVIYLVEFEHICITYDFLITSLTFFKNSQLNYNLVLKGLAN